MHISTAVLSKWLSDSTLDLEEIIVTPEWKTADGNSLLQIICQSEACLSRISSTFILKWLSITTLDVTTLPKLEAADDKSLLQHVCQSEIYVRQIPSSVMSKWLSDTTLDLINKVVVSNWKTADGNTLLELICQSKKCLSLTPSALLLKWIRSGAVPEPDLIKIFFADCKTADGDIPIKLLCQSKKTISEISSKVLSKWLQDTTFDLEKIIVTPEWKTADGITLIQLICQSETCLSRMSSILILKWLSVTTLDLTNNIPIQEAVDDKTLLKYVCQSEVCVSQISSAVMSKWLSDVTLNLVNTIFVPNWKTADGDTLLKLICQSKKCLSLIHSAALLKWVSNNTTPDIIKASFPDLKTADGDTLLQLVCQSNLWISQTSSSLLFQWLRDSTLDQVKISIPDSKTADDQTLLDLVCQSETSTSRISSAVFSKWLRDTSLGICHLVKIIKPVWKTADGDTLLKLVCQSETTVSQISSARLMKWLRDTNFDIQLKEIIPGLKTADGDTLLQLVCQCNICMSRISSAVLLEWLHMNTLCHVEISLPDSKTADGDSLLQLVCQSEIIVSHISSSVLSKWLRDTSLDVNLAKIIRPKWKTADGDTLLQLVCQSEITVLQVSSSVLSKWLSDISLDVDLAKIIIPRWKTADGDTLLQLICQSEICLLQIPSVVLLKWLSDTTVDLVEIITPDWKTADGDNLFQLICQSEALLPQISSNVFLNWLRRTPIKFVSKSIPDCKTADNDTLLKLVLKSAMCISQTSSMVLSKWLTDSSENIIDLFKMVDPNWKTLNGDCILHVFCQSRIDDKQLIKLMQYYMKENVNILDDNENTALHIACQVDKPALVSFLIKETCCDPNVKNKAGNLALDVTANLEVISYLCVNDQLAIYSKTVEGWMNNRLIDDRTMFCILQLLVDNFRYKTKDGSTLLHLICATKNGMFRDKEKIIRYLLIKGHCDPNCLDSKWQTPLELTSDIRIMKILVEHGAKMTTDVVFQVISSTNISDYEAIGLFTLSTRRRTMLWNLNDLNCDGYTALHLACKHDKQDIVNYLLHESKCEPNAKILFGSLLKFTTNLEIAKMLIKHGARVTPGLVLRFEAMEVIPMKSELVKLMLTTWNPDDRDSDGCTALHLACKDGRLTTVELLISVAHCNPNIKEGVYGYTALHLACKACNPDIMRVLLSVDHCDPNIKSDVDGYTALHLACKASNPAMVNLLLFVAHCDPNIKGSSDGYTALHLACENDNPAMVNLLLSVAHCDPNIKACGEVPLQVTTNPEIIRNLIRHGAKTSIMYKSYQHSLGTNKPVQPPVKIFIVGNPSVGKSTLTAALKKKLGIIARMFSGKVSGVDKKTVGIVPHDIESDTFGRVTLYDFAGHREFYSGHAALLQTAIQSTPPIFLLLINICEDKGNIIKNILYWISFLENQCASVSCKPHVILIGSHADTLKGVNPKDKIKKIVDSIDTKCFTNMEYVGFIPMNCRYHESRDMSDLRHLLIKSCDELRIHEPITFNAHCFLVFLIDSFMNLTAVTIKTIADKIENQQSNEGVLEFLPKDTEALYKICLELNDRGHILLLKNRIAAENSYVVIDKEFLLSEISGTVFAPEDFKQYKQLSTNTGVVPLTKIAESFPDKDLDILIGFLTHLEFCHEISDEALHQLISEQYSKVFGERYYLFPGLISVKADNTVWQPQLKYDYNFGWILNCIHLEQFFSSRFLQVLLLRLAFSYALKTSYTDPNQSIGIHRNCYLWKNGIFWGSVFGMQTLVEVTSDNKSVVLFTRFQDSNLLRCVKHRSEVIRTILQCKNEFCPRIIVTESFINISSPLQYPISLANEGSNTCTLQDLATAVVSDYVCPLVVLQCNTIPAKNFLSFEPYLYIKLHTIKELWDEKNEMKIISKSFLSRFVQEATNEVISLIKTFTGSSTNSTSKEQLYQDLLRWRDCDKTNQRSYKELCQAINQYSVFVGRNVLVSYDNNIKFKHFKITHCH